MDFLTVEGLGTQMFLWSNVEELSLCHLGHGLYRNPTQALCGIPVGFGGRRLPCYPDLLGNLSLKGVTFVSRLSQSSAVFYFLWNGDAVSRWAGSWRMGM